MTQLFSKGNSFSVMTITTGYAPVLDYFKIKDTQENYDALKQSLFQKLLDMAYLYSLNFAKLGCRAEAILANIEFLQKKWAKENNADFSNFQLPHLARQHRFLRSIIGKLPKIYYSFKSLADRKTWSWQILTAQIKKFRPDILFILDLHYFSPGFLKSVKPYARKIAGMISSPLFMPEDSFSQYDFIFSSLPGYVERFKNLGIKSALLPHAFEPQILKEISDFNRVYNCVFLGGMSRDTDRFPFFEELARKIDMDFWVNMNPPLSADSPIMKNYHGSAWGKEMYEILAKSKIVVNKHIEKHGTYEGTRFANNMRLYEATGMGALLITDWKENLGELFEIGKEVETYKSLEELVGKIQYYLTHDAEREKIAKAGQLRTLMDHNYEVRAKKILEILHS